MTTKSRRLRWWERPTDGYPFWPIRTQIVRWVSYLLRVEVRGLEDSKAWKIRRATIWDVDDSE